jgi:ribosomal-protein-alanine N-acetyltransferase
VRFQQSSGEFKVNSGVSDILTARLALIAITPDALQSEQLADGSLKTITAANVPSEWPPEHWEPHVFELLLQRFSADPTEVGWHRYIALREDDWSRRLIGTLGGFRKAETPEECEVGYSILSEFQGKGYATEATKAMIEWALAHPYLRTISAQTFPSLPKSIRVMEKCGMEFAGAGDEEGTVRYRLERTPDSANAIP